MWPPAPMKGAPDEDCVLLNERAPREVVLPSGFGFVTGAAPTCTGKRPCALSTVFPLLKDAVERTKQFPGFAYVWAIVSPVELCLLPSPKSHYMPVPLTNRGGAPVSLNHR